MTMLSLLDVSYVYWKYYIILIIITYKRKAWKYGNMTHKTVKVIHKGYDW